jgi:hypothetical protein
MFLLLSCNIAAMPQNKITQTTCDKDHYFGSITPAS